MAKLILLSVLFVGAIAGGAPAKMPKKYKQGDVVPVEKGVATLMCGDTVQLSANNGYYTYVDLQVDSLQSISVSACVNRTNSLYGSLTTSNGNYIASDSFQNTNCADFHVVLSPGSYNFMFYSFDYSSSYGGMVDATFKMNCTEPTADYYGELSCGSKMYASSGSKLLGFSLNIPAGVQRVIVDTCNYGTEIGLKLFDNQDSMISECNNCADCDFGATLRSQVMEGTYKLEASILSQDYWSYMPLRVSCVYDTCEADDLSKIGDKMCDGMAYNTKACGYDGGDCCFSTCYPAHTCEDSDSQCKDPSEAYGCPYSSKLYCFLDSIFGALF